MAFDDIVGAGKNKCVSSRVMTGTRSMVLILFKVHLLFG
jgi:hypothetical protein